MYKADRISGSFWLVFSLFISYESYKLGLGTLNQPGPGFLFFWTGILIAILALGIIAQALRRRSRDKAKEPASAKLNLTKVLLVLFALFFYALLMEPLGFFIVTLLLFIFLLGVIEKKRWWVAVFISFVVTVLSYLLFQTGLQSQLPEGFLGFLKF